eukprot:TRINITY_DN868_c2_g1_i1.p1 TRINITY_DN868_c2_g1~~TRINITY_DN868_c2_g1_i1.p1  ORF type:complete len:435 (+),score=100.72 TRINITY_DN868_c2_g1_i1:259-1563(+)
MSRLLCNSWSATAKNRPFSTKSKICAMSKTQTTTTTTTTTMTIQRLPRRRAMKQPKASVVDAGPNMGFFRKRRLRCDNCDDSLCSQCCGVYQFKALGWKKPRRCCFLCSEELAAIASLASQTRTSGSALSERGAMAGSDVGGSGGVRIIDTPSSAPIERAHNNVATPVAAKRERLLKQQRKAEDVALRSAAYLSPAVAASLTSALLAGSDNISDFAETDDRSSVVEDIQCVICAQFTGLTASAECRTCRRRICLTCSRRRLLPSFDAHHPISVCVQCASQMANDQPLAADSVLEQRVTLCGDTDVLCALPPHTCVECWRVMRASASAEAVAAGDEFFRLLAATPHPALRPLDQCEHHDSVMCHAHALADDPQIVTDVVDIVCEACNSIVQDAAIETLGHYFHQTCFNCATCSLNLAQIEFFVNEFNQFVCGDHV